MKILIADDDKEYCLGLKSYLQKNGEHEVNIAFDGDEAKHSLEKGAYDVILLDCDMPFASGIELIGVIKKRAPSAKIVMISGYEGIEENLARQAGINEFLRKPFTVKQLGDTLAKFKK